MSAPQPALDPWRCELCGTHYVVPALARECEDRHLIDRHEESPR